MNDEKKVVEIDDIPDVELDKIVNGNLDLGDDIDEISVVKDEVAKHIGHEKVSCLKVKADPQDISPEDRKKNVKKLAGAISHSLRANGEITVRAFGNAAIGKATKAIAIAKNYISANGQNLRLECAPAFVMAEMGEGAEKIKLTGISFFVFSVEGSPDDKLDIEGVKSVLMVKADPLDIDADGRSSAVKKLAGAISHSLEENKEVVVRCFGNATIGKAAKALAIARGYVATRGPDLYCWATFIMADINGSERTGIAWYVYVNG